MKINVLKRKLNVHPADLINWSRYLLFVHYQLQIWSLWGVVEEYQGLAKLCHKYPLSSRYSTTTQLRIYTGDLHSHLVIFIVCILFISSHCRPSSSPRWRCCCWPASQSSRQLSSISGTRYTASLTRGPVSRPRPLTRFAGSTPRFRWTRAS